MRRFPGLRPRAVIIVVAALALFVLFRSAPIEAEPGERAYRVAAFDYYPAMFRDSDGKVRGFYVEMLEEVARREGVEFLYVWGSWNEGLERARRGEVDLLTSVAWTAERATYLDFCAEPLLTVWGELYQRKDSKRMIMTDLSGKRVGVMHDDYNGMRFRETVDQFGIRCEFVEYPGFAAVFEAVKERKVDAGVASVLFGESTHERYGLSQTGIAFAPFDIFFAAPSGSSAELLAALDGYLSRWKEDPSSVYYEARLKWRSGQKADAMPPWLRYALVVATIAAVAAFVFSIALRYRVHVVTRALRDKETELRRERDFGALLLDSISEGVLGIGGDGLCAFCNGGFVQLLGFSSAGEVIGKTISAVMPTFEALPEREGDPSPVDFNRADASRRHLEAARVVRADGGSFLAEVWTWPMAFERGDEGLVVSIIDITGRFEAERARAATEVAERANRAKSEFISRMSHELRTPLNSVIVLSGVLARRLDGKLSEDERSYLEVIERNGRRLLEMINEILDLSRIESGRDETVLSVRDVAVSLAECVALVAPQAEAKGLSMAVEPIAGPLLASVDERKLRHVLENLLVNAVKYTREGGVTVSARAEGNGILVEIADTGIGIRPELVPRVFDEFMQADGADLRQGGVGLGLAIAKRYAEAMGGSLAARSVVGKGSVFSVRLPAPAGSARMPPGPGDGSRAGAVFSNARAESRNAPPRGREAVSVLVIDDDPDGRLAVGALLRDGYEVREARNGVEGLMVAAAFRPDVVLLDLTMPGLSGTETLGLLRNTPSMGSIPVVAVSASVVDPRSLFAAGFDAFVQKPIDPDSLIRAIKELT